MQDIRKPSDRLVTQVPSDVESGMWSMHDEHYLVVSSEDGYVSGFDARKFSKPVFRIQAHPKAVTSVSLHHTDKRVMATSSVDGIVKIWDISQGPKLIE